MCGERDMGKPIESCCQHDASALPAIKVPDCNSVLRSDMEPIRPFSNRKVECDGDPDAVSVIALYRSEEHTSELQSLMRNSYAVFCLKKTTNKPTQSHHHQNNSILRQAKIQSDHK